MDDKRLISKKIGILRREGTPAKQSVAMAFSMARARRIRPDGSYIRAPKRGGAR